MKKLPSRSFQAALLTRLADAVLDQRAAPEGYRPPPCRSTPFGIRRLLAARADFTLHLPRGSLSAQFR